MRKKQIFHVVEGRVLSDEPIKKPAPVNVSWKNERKMRQREWDHGGLDIDSLQHFNTSNQYKKVQQDDEPKQQATSCPYGKRLVGYQGKIHIVVFNT